MKALEVIYMSWLVGSLMLFGDNSKIINDEVITWSNSILNEVQNNIGSEVNRYGGTVITCHPVNNATLANEQKEFIEDIMKKRIDGLKLSYSSSVEINNSNSLTIKIPGQKISLETAKEITKMGKLEFIDSEEVYPSPGQLLTDGQVILSGSDVVDVNAIPFSEGIWEIAFTISDNGRKKLADATSKLALEHKPIIITLDRLVISAPVVESRIDANEIRITGEFDKVSAQELANLIKYGALPLDIRIVDIRYIEPRK